jgi:DivIVA domain-containing protein
MSSDPHLDAGGIVQRQFTTARRGYDADEVRAYLHELATMVGSLRRSEADVRARAERAEARAHKAEQLDEHRLVEILGEETARVLDAARAASTDIRGKAEESASRLISEANHEAHRVRAEAEAAIAAQRAELLAEVEKLRADAASELDRRRAEGAEIVAQMRREAQAECDSLRQHGEQKRLEAEMQAETIRTKAREEGRALIAEAQVVRERVLGDLARRRRTSREQLERLNAARERLLAAYEVVRRTVDEATGELTVVLPEAKVAGDTAVRRVKGEPEPSVEQLEDMVAMARITGLIEDAAAQGIDEEDYLADDAPPPAVALAETDEREEPGEPVELYDLELESESDLADVVDDESEPFDLAGAEPDEADDEGAAEANAGDGTDDSDDSDDSSELADVDAAQADDADHAEPVTVNGHAPTVAAGMVATTASDADPAPEPAVAAVALASEPRYPAGGGATDTTGGSGGREPEPVAPSGGAGGPSEMPAAESGGVDDRRLNGHAHPAVEVDDDEDLDGDDTYDDTYDDDDEDLGDGWHDAGEDALGTEPAVTSNVDELFARLKAGRDRPAPGPEPVLEPDVPEDDHDEVDLDFDHDVDHDEEDDRDGDVVAAPAGHRVSSLAAMSDADILASAGYGDAGEDGYGYGSAEGDDLSEDGEPGEGDDYGLAITPPDPSTVVESLDDLDADDVGADADDVADFADMHPDEAMLRLRDDSLETVEHDLSRRLKRILSDEQNEVLDTLRRHKPASLDELLPGGRDAHAARYADAAVEGLSTAAAWGAASVEGEPAGSYAALAGELGRTVVEPLRERIDRSFAESGGDVDDVTGRLRALYREWKGHHIAAAAQHYAVAAYARGAYEAVPDGTPVRWLVDRGGDACPDADDNALADSVCKGEAFPTGDRCPPAHPGCRCMVVPIDWPQLG